MSPERLFKLAFVTAMVLSIAQLNFAQADKVSKQEEASRDNKRFRVQGKLINFRVRLRVCAPARRLLWFVRDSV